jgi:hypothetical protein
MNDESLFQSIKGATRKGRLFGNKALYKQVAPISEDQLRQTEMRLNCQLPEDVRATLLALGACAVDELYMHAAEDIYAFDDENGAMAGYITFASDVCGNYFAFDPRSNNPVAFYYCSHDPFGYAVIKGSFREYLQAFVESEFDTVSLTDKLELHER